MSVAPAELPAPALADICVKRPRISTRPLLPSEYHPPGTSRTSRIKTGSDANQIYNATVHQRTRILEQLEEAEQNARDALYTLATIEIELASETDAMKSTLSRLSATLPVHEFDKMLDFTFGQSKEEWEKVWKRDWEEDGNERSKYTMHFGAPSREPRSNPPLPPPTHHPPSSPLPPSSPPPPTSPPNPQGHVLPHTAPVHTSEVTIDGSQRPIRPFPRPALDGFGIPQRSIDHDSGSTRYQLEPVASPSQPQRSHRLKRDERQLGLDRNGMPVPMDRTKENEAQHREIRGTIRLQAKEKGSLGAENALLDTAQRPKGFRYTPYTKRGPPVARSGLFEDKRVETDDLTNPFAQGDQTPPTDPN